MNISSFNVTDVTYHYIGLRVLANLPVDQGKSIQAREISRGVQKFVTDKALRLMLSQPGGTFKGTGDKICQELVHFRFARSAGRRYEVTESGHQVLRMLASGEFKTLRRMMARVHLQTYDNLRNIVKGHIEIGTVWRPVVETAKMFEKDYVTNLLSPTFKEKTAEAATEFNIEEHGMTRSKLQDALHNRIIQSLVPNQRIGVANFRAICDRLVTLRLLNQRRTRLKDCEFIVSYSPCVIDVPQRTWYVPLEVSLEHHEPFHVFFCEPNMNDDCQQEILLCAVDLAFRKLKSEGGYYDIPDVRDWVCHHLMIPEAVFDDGINQLLDRQPSILSVGLHYDRITARRRPLVRQRQNVQLHNLIRRV